MYIYIYMFVYIHTNNQRQLFNSNCPEVFCNEVALKMSSNLEGNICHGVLLK